MKLIYYFIAFLLVTSLAGANSYEQEFNVKNNDVDVLININFDYASNFNFNLDLPSDVDSLNVLVDDEEKNFEVLKYSFGNTASINGTAKNLKISYNSKVYIENGNKNYFTAEVLSLLDNEMKITVVLPEGATLDKSFKNLEETSVYPKPDKIDTNGKNLIIVWEYDSKKDDSYPLFVIYNIKEFNYIYLILSMLLVIAAVYFILKKTRKVLIKTIKVSNVEEHLKDEEKLIVNILKQKEGECTQATLVTLTNMSKASLSRLLNELEKRNVIEKKEKGNKNLIILKKGDWNVLEQE